jgi:hypothetical protein
MTGDRSCLEQLVNEINSLPSDPELTTDALRAYLIHLDLDLVPRAVAAAADPAGYRQPTVTVASLFERAATLVDSHDWAKARTYLDVVTETTSHPALSAYRALTGLLEAFDEPGSAAKPVRDVAWDMERDLRTRVYDLLVRGPDAAPPTGQETF